MRKNKDINSRHNTLAAASDKLYLQALIDTVEQYPRYFFHPTPLSTLSSRWDIQPDFSQLEHLLLEDESTKQFIFCVWSFYSPISYEQNSLAETLRTLQHWQKHIICTLIMNDTVK